MDFTEKEPDCGLGCQEADRCPLASRLKAYERGMRQAEHRINETCSRIGQVFRQIADSLQGVADAETMVRPLARLDREDMLRECIRRLMEERDADGCFLMKRKSQWQAIYRILVDRGLGVAEGDYAGFERLVWRIQPDAGRGLQDQLRSGWHPQERSRWYWCPRLHQAGPVCREECEAARTEHGRVHSSRVERRCLLPLDESRLREDREHRGSRSQQRRQWRLIERR